MNGDFKTVLILTISLMLFINKSATGYIFFSTNSLDKVTVENKELSDPHVKKFEEIFNTKVKTKIRFGYVDTRYAGICFLEHNYIIINTMYLSEYTYLELEQLIFHELGHCHMKIKAHDTREYIGIPRSIMYPVMQSDWTYVTNKNMYIKDLNDKRLDNK